MRDPAAVYQFVYNFENFPRWAKMFCLSVKRSNDEWIAETPQGPARVRLAKRNELGVLDHYVKPSPDLEVFVPMRVVQNESGSEVIFTVFQLAGISDEQYAEDIKMVWQDLKNLKSVLEN